MGERQLQDWTKKTVNWIKEKVSEAGCSGTVVGVSGGVDSAVIAALCARATPENVLGLILPCESPPEDVSDGELVIETTGIEKKIVSLDETYDALISSMDIDKNDEDMALNLGNVKARLRMTTLYFHAQMRDSLVVGGSNRDELYLGYFTKHADSGVDLMPIGKLVKAEVSEVAEYLGIPERIIERPPSAGLWPGQTDEDEMGLRYEDIDRYLLKGRADDEVVEEIESEHRKSEHKRQMPPVGPYGLGVEDPV